MSGFINAANRVTGTINGVTGAVTRTIGGINNAIGTVTNVVGQVENQVNQIGDLIYGSGDGAYGGGLNGASGTSWIDQLQPASWRGIGFFVDSEQATRGRRTVIHQYPFRDDVWVEDLGRAMRPQTMSVYVVGDDCYQQANALIAACEQPGSGQLVHPWLGTLTVALTAPVTFTTRKDYGRAVELQMQFVETGLPVYPSTDTDTAGAVDDAADDMDDEAEESFGDRLEDAASAGASLAQQAAGVISGGAAIATAAVNTVKGVVNSVENVIGDASLVVHAVTGIPAAVGYSLGRFADGARGAVLNGANTVEAAIGAVTNAKNAANLAAANLTILAGNL